MNTESEPLQLAASNIYMTYGTGQKTAQQKNSAPAPAGMNLSIPRPVLSGVNLRLTRGESLAIMGPSGSGKSTLLHILAGITVPTSGAMMWNGLQYRQMSDAQRTKLRRSEFGFVFQSGQLLPELPALENVALPLMLSGAGVNEAKQHAQGWLVSLGLGDLMDRRPGELSGGQSQRVAIARAMVINPSVIFADEPTGALDQQTGMEVMSLLSHVAQQNSATLVVVTHDAHVASFCSRTVQMQDGVLLDTVSAAGVAAPAPAPTPAPMTGGVR
jgi:putative ABC transport system ATP-binding protein